LASVLHIATKVTFMDKGVVVEEGAPEVFFTNPKEPRTRQFLSRYLTSIGTPDYVIKCSGGRPPARFGSNWGRSAGRIL